MKMASAWQLIRRLDWQMAAIMLALLALGVVLVFSAESRGGAPAAEPLYRKQLLWMAVGLVGFGLAAAIDYHWWLRLAWWLYGLGLVLLALVFVPQVGVRLLGAQRWLHLPGFGFFQPAEFMKLAALLALARLFGWPGRAPRGPRLALSGLAVILVPLLLLMLQPDLGTALVFVPLLVVIMFAAGMPVRTLAWLSAAGVLAGLLFLSAAVLPARLGWERERQDRLARLVGLNAYQRERILVFLDGGRDPLGTGWNRAQSRIAIGSGRLWGKGYRQGAQNILGFLPRTVTPNDFIFAVLAEEKGFAGALVLLSLFAGLLHALLRAAAAAADRLGRLLCAGVAALIFTHVFVNIAMTMGLLPVTGLPLPLISYGGTFLAGTLTALGLAQGVYLRGDWR